MTPDSFGLLAARSSEDSLATARKQVQYSKSVRYNSARAHARGRRGDTPTRTLLPHTHVTPTEMPAIRNQLSSVAAGGRRQWTELRDKLLITTQEGQQNEVASQLESRRFNTRVLNVADVVIAEPQDRLDGTLDSLTDELDDAQEAVEEIRDGIDESDGAVEAGQRVVSATDELISKIADIPEVLQADFGESFADYGPENLRMSPFEMQDVDNTEERSGTLQDVIEALDIPKVWNTTRGENSIVAIFDTAYSPDLISESRIAATFSAEEVDSVYNSPEGHGTMCAGAAAANSEEGVPMDGVAPNAEVILVRTTGADGQIRSDVIAQAWDWITDQTDGRPIIANHSYGTPICSSLQRASACESSLNNVIRQAASEPTITPVYAAGNEAMYCGHRLSGITNGITGTNSIAEVVTVGALLTNGQDAQRYSSHGRGDCAPRADPKPNVSFRIPKFTYYGGENGFKIKDMSTGAFGSGGGTSHAAPCTTGALALLQSHAFDVLGEPLQTEEIKIKIENHSDPPRPTQVNQTGFFLGPAGWDARFGNGQFKVGSALDSIV